ncbi:hypothetical protein CLOSTHATH_05697 [Hungatella hathewayi DSM 13479]|uniref:Uncharacterized protein n=1 Tax=Hungatella hathewayi DSM 13479 TaxID=566550 RepID=D3APZ1_9FIRM|nr:hypothetical protein CLOSTHATH_05697 [Hungatella hathewayi DSM 13479]
MACFQREWPAQLENRHKNVRKLYLNESVICSRLKAYGFKSRTINC